MAPASFCGPIRSHILYFNAPPMFTGLPDMYATFYSARILTLLWGSDLRLGRVQACRAQDVAFTF